MTVRGQDGEEFAIEAGDVYVIEPGHEAWVDGDVPCILYGPEESSYALPTG